MENIIDGEPHEEFKNDIQEWNRVDALIKQFEGNLKQLRQEKKAIQEVTVKYMAENDIDACNLGDGKVILKKSKSKISQTTKTALPEKVCLYFKQEENMDENIAKMRTERLVNFIYSNPEYKESLTLTRTKKRNMEE